MYIYFLCVLDINYNLDINYKKLIYVYIYNQYN